MASFLDTLAGDGPDYSQSQTHLPANQQAFIDNARGNALNSQATTQGALNQAVAGAQNTFAPHDMTMNAALTNKYRTSLARGLQGVQANNLLKPYQTSEQALAGASQVATAQRQIQTKNLEMMRDAALSRDQARSQVLGSLLGLSFAGAGAANRKSSPQSGSAPQQSQFSNDDFSNMSQADSSNAGYTGQS